jgi:DNA excision repair protein ERCC-2
MDGFYKHEPPRIEEIKTSFNIFELKQKLRDPGSSHPYCLQLQTYGYFYWLQNKIIPELTFHLVSTRKNDVDDLPLQLNIEVYEAWLNRRLDELVEEAKRSEKRTLRRQKISKNFAFPFENPRPGQKDLIQSIEEGMASKDRMWIQAPTGLGKTAGVLYPVLKEALARGQRVVYVTPKNSQHSVAEDAVIKFQETGSPVKALTITAKSKICFKNEPLCNPEYCEYAKDYYTKVADNALVEVMARKKNLTAKVFKKLGEEFEVCPFELQMAAAQEVDTVICDYNYAFAPQGLVSRLSDNGLGQVGKPNLVVDEAHNLPSRGMDYYSPALSSAVLEKMREETYELPIRFRGEAEEIIEDCLEAILSCRPELPAGSKDDIRGKRGSKIEPPTEPFLEQDLKLKNFLSRYLDSDVEIKPRDVILRISFYWSEFTEALAYVRDPSRTEFFTTYTHHPSGGTVKIVCCDASKMLQSCYSDYDQVVGFSATLKPFEYYSKLSGLEGEKVKFSEFQSPFLKTNRKVLIIPQISTKYSERERNYSKIADAVRRITELRRGNYFVFFPSFDFLGRVLDSFRAPEGFTILRQARDMKKSEVDDFLGHLKSEVAPTLLFAVQGGVFSEGVDYPGNMIIGAFVVGPPLPIFDLEREEMREYYQKNYGSGFDYAYTYPAMAKAVQAAGRVIRSETDRGLIVLMDSRFTHPSYTRSMPTDWFERSATELVSTRILKEISDFWNN